MNLISKELNEKAIELAQASLKKGFDWQAFLVISLAQQNLNTLNTPKEIIDYVPESVVDENIQLFLKKFISFSNKNTNENNIEILKELLQFLKKIINELYFSSETTEERKLFEKFINSFNF